MSDVYTSVSNRSLGDNLVESIKGFLIGIVMFIAAFPILWLNEGCTDMSTVAKTAVVVNADNPGSSGEGKLIAVTANLKSDENVGDPDMLAPGSYVMLRRKVEMYAWNEKKESHTEKKLGGGSKTVTKVTYDLMWSEDPQKSSTFEHEDGHENPDPGVQKQTYYPTHARVGAFSFSPHDCQLPPPEPVALSASIVKVSTPAPRPAPAPATNKGKTKGKATAAVPPPPAPPPPEVPSAGAFRFTGSYLYKGRGNPDKPLLGDVRVSYEAVTPGAQVTLYGKRQGTSVIAFVNDNDDKLFRAVPGTHEQAMAQLHTEAVMLRWIGRIGGFLCMWIGLSLLLAPFNAVLDIVPFIGSAGRFVTGLAMFPISLVLSVITILVSIVAHNPILVVLTFLLVVGGLVALIVTKKKKAPAMQPQPAGMPPMGYGGPPQGGYGGYGGPPQGGYGPPPGGGYGGPPQGGYGPPPGGGYGGPPVGGA